ncbi:MAG: tetratricopeptide repeat-containing glycosyltransferase family protein [Isosphaeraceae bacterium]|nr:tetratricopeptide repeat-containing glycosyltransferase family protein [Isosphaeraceae bacterium]
MLAISDAEASAWARLQAGDLAGAELVSREILRHEPEAARVWFVLGAARQLRGDLGEAAGCYHQALRVRPDLIEAWSNLGLVRQGQGATDEAVHHFRQALRLNPEFADAHNNLGIALHGQGATAEAVHHLRQAIHLRPGFADAHHNLGNALRSQGRPAEALECYDRALDLAPDRAEMHLSRALLRIRTGDFERGWPEYEWRWRCPAFPPPRYAQPAWDGAPLAGRTILLFADHGLGDTLQFIRYAPLVQRRGGRVVVACQHPLARLLASCPGVERVVPEGEPLPRFDVYAPLMSLPRLFGTTVASVPAEVPYLRSDPRAVANWRRVLEPDGKINVGVVWQGNPRYGKDRERSFRLAQLEPLARVPGVRFISLQNGAATEQIGAVADRFAVLDLGNQLGDFLDIASAMRSLDLVVTPDTALAHLAGALGIPAWVALAFDPDFRWLDGRDDSPWYPAHRLFRQRRPGEWDEVFARMAAALAGCHRNDATVATIIPL